MKRNRLIALSAIVILATLAGCGEKEDMSTPITGEVTAVENNTITLKTDSKTYTVKVTDATEYTFDGNGMARGDSGEMPEGMTGEAPRMPTDGERPEMPENGEMPEGFTMPENGEAPEGFTMPENGEAPEGFTMPENGEAPEGFTMPENGEMPEGFTMPENGEAPEMPQGGFGGNFTMDLSSVTVGSTVTIERNDDGTARRVLLSFSPQNMGGPVGNES